MYDYSLSMQVYHTVFHTEVQLSWRVLALLIFHRVKIELWFRLRNPVNDGLCILKVMLRNDDRSGVGEIFQSLDTSQYVFYFHIFLHFYSLACHFHNNSLRSRGKKERSLYIFLSTDRNIPKIMIFEMERNRFLCCTLLLLVSVSVIVPSLSVQFEKMYTSIQYNVVSVFTTCCCQCIVDGAGCCCGNGGIG